MSEQSLSSLLGIPDMKPLRRAWVNALLVATLALVAFSIQSGREFWPICNYPMFDLVDEHPEQDSIEFYMQAKGEPERWIHEDASIGRLHHDFTLNAILRCYPWPSHQAVKAFHAVIQEMRWERRPMDPAWSGPIHLRAYRVSYVRPTTGPVRVEIRNRTLLFDIEDPTP